MTRAIAALVRHGDYAQAKGVPSAQQPYPLTETGLQQATDCGSQLAALAASLGRPLAPVIHCSRQLRAWQTASRIAEVLSPGHVLLETSDLSERRMGSAANLTVAEIEAALAADPRFPAPPEGWKADRNYRLPYEGAESMVDAGRRVADWIDATVSQDPAKAGFIIVFVGHGAAFRHAACELGALEAPEVAKLSMHHARPVLLERQAPGRWQKIAGDWKQRSARDSATD
ncbi:MAG: histidine phosphatase family protein [Pseudomonadota bacterium]